MKKILLSGFVIVSFLLYSLSMRHQNGLPVIAMPTASGQGNSPNSPSGSTPGTTQTTTTYKDGTYTGPAADAYYGNVQVEAIIQGGKITSVVFLQYPNSHQYSVAVNQQAMPYLQQEAIKAQSAQVNGVSGATATSQAFVQSLSAALQKAA